MIYWLTELQTKTNIRVQHFRVPTRTRSDSALRLTRALALYALIQHHPVVQFILLPTLRCSSLSGPQSPGFLCETRKKNTPNETKLAFFLGLYYILTFE